MNRMAVGALALPLFLMTACATHQDIISNGVYRELHSNQPAPKVAVCISRNSDDYFVGLSMLTKVIYTGQEPIEVEMRNGGSQYAKVLVSSTSSGSRVEFLYSNLARLNFPDKTIEILSKGCL